MKEMTRELAEELKERIEAVVGDEVLCEAESIIWKINRIIDQYVLR